MIAFAAAVSIGVMLIAIRQHRRQEHRDSASCGAHPGGVSDEASS